MKRVFFVFVILIISSCMPDGDGILFPYIPIQAEFNSTTQNIFEGEEIQFFDSSLGTPTSWEWTFEGGEPSYSNETNPTILYRQKGVYQVKLKVTNEDGTSENITGEYINVKDDLLKGLVGKFDLDTDATDSSGYDNHGRIVGQIYPTTNRNNIPYKSMYFSNNKTYLSMKNPSEIKSIKNISISVWISSEEKSYEYEAIVNKWYPTSSINAVGTGFYLGLNQDGKIKWLLNSDAIEGKFIVPDETWVHYVATYDGISMKLYENGALIAQKDILGLNYQNNKSFKIGGQSTVEGYGFKGKIDDVRIYNRALNNEEINELFNIN